MSDPILIWGAGAIGGTIGAHLVRQGHEVHFVDLAEDHISKIARQGLRIDGPLGEFTVRAPAMLPKEVSGRYARVFLAVKAQHTEPAVRAIMPHLAAEGYILSCQNGLNEPLIASLVGRERTIGTFVNFGADWQGAGHITFGGRGAVVIGELDGALSERAQKLLATLQDFEPDAVLTDNIYGYLWSKLAYATVLKAEALTQETIVGFLSRAELRPLVRGLVRSVLRIALAEKVVPMPFQAFDPQAFLTGHDADADACVEAIIDSRRGSAKLYSGVWRDIMVRRRRTEVPYQLGPVIEAGQRHGLPTATLQALVDRIRAVEEGMDADGITLALDLRDIAIAEGI